MYRKFGMMYLISAFLTLTMVLIFLFACSSPLESPSTFPVQITDQSGKEVKLDKAPQRIISLAPSNTEILFALGLADRVVGVTEYCDYPQAAKEKPKIGGYSTVDFEKVVQLEPDIIFATNKHQADTIPKLEEFGLTVVVINPETIEEVFEAITLIGNCTGKSQEASQLVTEMSSQVQAVVDKTRDLLPSEMPRVFYVVRADPLYTAGSGTLIDELITLAGGTNIFHSVSSYPSVNLEEVIQANPQVIIAGSSMGSAEPALGFLGTDDRLENVDARTNNKLYEIDVDIVSRPGPRLTEALSQLASMIQPEIFGSIQ
jgi:iron complex transport system substrate-binding protein